jgi:protein-L-isoaspartate(D-aspartate) O-methyltransferase
VQFDELRGQLVNKLKREARISTQSVESAFYDIPRELFVPNDQKKYAYDDQPLSIGHGQTISAPHMVAIMAEALDIHEGQKILEIGAGSGYHAAIVSKIVGSSGHVYSVERFSVLAETARKHLSLVGISNVSVSVGDGSEGLSEYAPYDRIYVTCAAPSIPKPLVDQLSDGGKLLIPVGGRYATLMLIEKYDDELKKRDLGGCAFVPMVGRYGYD